MISQTMWLYHCGTKAKHILYFLAHVIFSQFQNVSTLKQGGVIAKSASLLVVDKSNDMICKIYNVLCRIDKIRKKIR